MSLDNHEEKGDYHILYYWKKELSLESVLKGEINKKNQQMKTFPWKRFSKSLIIV